MSHEATSLVKSRAFGSVSVKAVALVLADYCDAEWSAFVGQDRLAWEAEVSPRTVRRILVQLEGAGLVTRHARYRSGHRTSDLIRLVPDAINALPARLSGTEFIPANGGSIPATGDVHTGQSLARESLEEPSDTNRVCGLCDGVKFTFDAAGAATPCACHPKRKLRKIRGGAA